MQENTTTTACQHVTQTSVLQFEHVVRGRGGRQAGRVATEREFSVGGSHSTQTIKVWQLQYSKIDTTHLRLNLVHCNTSRVALSQLHSLTTSKPPAPLLDLQYLVYHSTPQCSKVNLFSNQIILSAAQIRRVRHAVTILLPRLHRAHCRVTVAACRQGAPCRG